MWGVMEGGAAGFSELVPDPSLLAPGPMLSGLACCHTVTLLQGQPLGDPLELKMVESTGWVRHYCSRFFNISIDHLTFAIAC